MRGFQFVRDGRQGSQQGDANGEMSEFQVWSPFNDQ
jgi:hypothetical protein